MMLSEKPTVKERVSLVDTVLGAWTEVETDCVLENVVLGDYSYLQPRVMAQNVDIGKFSNVAANVRLGPTQHPMERPTLHHFTYRPRQYGLAEIDDEAFFDRRRAQRATLGHDTWIGHGAIVMPGVTVGTGAIVGAAAVVTKDVAPYTVVGGVPARFIKERFSSAIAEALLDLAWWDWTHEQLRERLEDFRGPIEAFLERWGKQ